MFSRTDYILGNQTSLNKFKKIEIISSIFSDHNVMKLEINFRGKKKTEKNKYMRTIQFSSVAQSCPTLCDPMNRSTPSLPVHHQPPEFTQTHVHRHTTKNPIS